MPGGESQPVRLSVVIPAYNAGAVIGSTVAAVHAYFRRSGESYEVIVVDDGSTDDTAAAVSRQEAGTQLLRLERNRGKGAAVRAGMLAARGEWVLFMDADHATRIEQLALVPLDEAEADIYIGSRRHPQAQSRAHRSRLRRLLSELFPRVVRRLVLPGLADTQCGFKVFRGAVVGVLFERQRCEHFCFDVELLLIARRLGLRVCEIPVAWDNPPASSLRVLRDSTRMFIDLLRIAWWHRARRYADGADWSEPRPSQA